MPDARTQMLQASKEQNPNFPDGNESILTQFAYIGTVTTAQGIVRVAACRSIISGMLSPRGQAWLSFHAEDGTFVGSRPYVWSAPPLWCEGSRIYFFGLQGSDEEGVGNALELADGLETARWVTEQREGSWMPALTSSQTSEK